MACLLPSGFEFPIEILPKGKGYKVIRTISYHSNRYRKDVTAHAGMYTDGASGPAEDILSLSWVFHDVLCSTGKWDDGTPCSNWQASWVLHDILAREGRWGRKWTWWLFTGVGRPIWNCLEQLNPWHKEKRRPR